MGKFGKPRSFGGRSRDRSEAHGRDFNENRPSRFRPDSDGPRPFERSSSGKPRNPGRFNDFDSPRPTPFVRTSKGPMELFDAICDKCGAQCELPFKPRGGKPVYCRDCFRKNNSSEFGEEPTQSGGSTISTEQFITLNRKLDKIMRALKLD